jgi:type I restriction enzyme S subunit
MKYAVTFPAKSEVRSLPPDHQVSFVPMDGVGEYGGLRLTDTRAIEDVMTGYTFFRDDDVVVAKITPCFENGKGALAKGLEGGIAFGTTELHVLRAKEFLPEFLFYLTISRDFRELGTAEMYGAGGQKRVPERFLRDLQHPIPPLDEQAAIVAFLNRETVRIDLLIAEKTRLIELLAEKRAAVITHAVTKGLDSNARMTISGIPWFGEVPAHWQVKQLKFAVTFQRGHDLTSDERTEGNVPVVTSAGASSWHDRAAARGPGIVTGRYGTIGVFHLIETDYWPHNTTLYSINLRGNDAKFLSFMLHVLSGVFLINSGKSAVPGIDRNDLHPVAVAVPPVSEQVAITKYIDTQLDMFHRLSCQVEVAIDHLREYRSALITAAVTGRIDVREVGRKS